MVHDLVMDDARLKPIAEKVLSGERLSLDDGIALYRTPDLLAVGWLANHVREQRHGNHDRGEHALARREKDPATARGSRSAGWRQAVTKRGCVAARAPRRSPASGAKRRKTSQQ